VLNIAWCSIYIFCFWWKFLLGLWRLLPRTWGNKLISRNGCLVTLLIHIHNHLHKRRLWDLTSTLLLRAVSLPVALLLLNHLWNIWEENLIWRVLLGLLHFDYTVLGLVVRVSSLTLILGLRAKRVVHFLLLLEFSHLKLLIMLCLQDLSRHCIWWVLILHYCLFYLLGFTFDRTYLRYYRHLPLILADC
jgi:hypothetical protein